MRKLTKIMLCISALFSLICMGMSIYVGVVFHDITWYLVALLFALATVWLSINAHRAFKEEKESQEEGR